MKEATGELNMTVVTVVAIAAVGAFFYLVVWPGIHRSISQNTNCANAICSTCNGGSCNCQYLDDNDQLVDIVCPNKNE